MPFRSQSIIRDIATAFAVVAFYLLTLLVPLHQAAGLQRDLARLGYATAQWSICDAFQPATGKDVPAAVKCPVAGIAKFEVATLHPQALGQGNVRFATPVAYAGIPRGNRPGSHAFSSQPRAPPITI